MMMMMMMMMVVVVVVVVLKTKHLNYKGCPRGVDWYRRLVSSSKKLFNFF